MINMAAKVDSSFSRRKYIGNNQDENLDDSRELFDSSLITAMRMADSCLSGCENIKISDGWKPEWDVAVQIPRATRKRLPNFKEIDVPRKHTAFNFETHFDQKRRRCTCTDSRQLKADNLNAEPSRKRYGHYDIDTIDEAWLTSINTSLCAEGKAEIDKVLFEVVMEYFELLWQRKNPPTDEDDIVSRHNGGLFDPTVCDVCRSVNEDENYSRCSSCNLLVHRACYGVSEEETQRKSRSPWLCRPCASELKPSCALCLRFGGALKPNADESLWCHVSCVLWTPECSLADPVLLEPVVQLECIPDERWNETCSLCNQRGGACLFCSADGCKVPFHVRCAFVHSLTMNTQFADDDVDVRLLAFCSTHSNTSSSKDADRAGQQSQSNNAYTELVNEEQLARLAKFLDANIETVRRVAAFWRLKRTANFHKRMLRKASPVMFADWEDLLRDDDAPIGESSRLSLDNDLTSNVNGAKNGDLDNSEVAESSAKEAAEPVKPSEPRSLVEQVRDWIGLRKNLDQLRNVVYLIQRRERVRRQHLLTMIGIREAQLSAVAKLAAARCPKDEAEPADNAADANANTGVVSTLNEEPNDANQAAASAAGQDVSIEPVNKRSRRETILQKAHVGASLYDNPETFNALLERYRAVCGFRGNDAANRDEEECMLTEADYALLTEDANDFLVQYILERHVRARVKVSAVLSKLNCVRKVTLSSADRFPNAKRIADRLVKLAKSGRPPTGKDSTTGKAVNSSAAEQPTKTDVVKRHRSPKKQTKANDRSNANAFSRVERALAQSIPEAAFQIDAEACQRLKSVFANDHLVRNLLVERARAVLNRLSTSHERDADKQVVANALPPCESDQPSLMLGVDNNDSLVVKPMEIEPIDKVLHQTNGYFESACKENSDEIGMLYSGNGLERVSSMGDSPLDALEFLTTLESELS